MGGCILLCWADTQHQHLHPRRPSQSSGRGVCWGKALSQPPSLLCSWHENTDRAVGTPSKKDSFLCPPGLGFQRGQSCCSSRVPWSTRAVLKQPWKRGWNPSPTASQVRAVITGCSESCIPGYAVSQFKEERWKMLHVRYCLACLFPAFHLDLGMVHLVLCRLRTFSCWMSGMLTTVRFRYRL